MQNRIMKIYYLFLFLVLITFSNANAQITKGNWIVGGSLSYIRINNSSPNNALYKESILNIKPIVGYFLKDKFALG